MPAPLRIEPGSTFGRWTVLYEVETSGNLRNFYCVCVCSSKKVVRLSSLSSGISRSCGCIRDEVASARWRTHGQSNRPGYSTWRGMIGRCYHRTRKSYIHYGGRGIRVCKAWHNPESFLDWLESQVGWFEGCGLEVDRQNNDGGYSPSNCRLVTKSQNRRNTRLNLRVVYKGESVTLYSLWERYGTMAYGTTAARIVRGWTLKDALFSSSSRHMDQVLGQ